MNWKDWIRVLSGAAVLIVFCTSIYYLWLILSNASEQIIAVGLTGFISIVTIFFGRFLEQRREQQQRTNSERVRIYQDISSTFLSFFLQKSIPVTEAGDHSEAPLDLTNEQANKLRTIQSELLFWGSDNVILSWERLNMHLRAANSDSQENQISNLAISLGLLARLTLAMRRDVGYPNTKINEENYARLTLANGDSERALIELMKSNLKRLDGRK